MADLSGTLRTLCLVLALLGLVQCAALLAFILTIRHVQKEIRLLQSIRRSWRLSIEAVVQAALDRQRKARKETSVFRIESLAGAPAEARPAPAPQHPEAG